MKSNTQQEKDVAVRNTGKGTIYSVMTLFLVFSWLLSSCSEKGGELVIIDRVLLVYLGGDNNLSDEGHEKLEAIRRGWKPAEDSRILVYQDAADMLPRLLEINENNMPETIAEYEAENSADPKVFGRVIAQAKALYPKARFNLLVFSHASGWLPGNSLDAPKSVPVKSILVDKRQQMELIDFAEAIPDKAFEYIVFETCFMAGIETVYQLRDKADYILASSAEIVSPGFTAVYPLHVNELVYGNPQTFMQEAFGYFDNQTEHEYMRSATFSMIRTDRLEPLALYIRDNCDFTGDTGISGMQHFDRNRYHLFFDFGQYYSSLLETEEQKRQLQDLIARCVVWKASTPCFMQEYSGFAIERHSGLTTYIMQDDYPLLNESYAALEWYKSVR
jgi:hypothetical protein